MINVQKNKYNTIRTMLYLRKAIRTLSQILYHSLCYISHDRGVVLGHLSPLSAPVIPLPPYWPLSEPAAQGSRAQDRL